MLATLRRSVPASTLLRSVADRRLESVPQGFPHERTVALRAAERPRRRLGLQHRRRQGAGLRPVRQRVAEVRLPTDLWTDGGVSELNLMQLEGQARASARGARRPAARPGPARRLARRRHLRHAPHGRPHRRRAQPGPSGHLLERPDAGGPPRRRARAPRRPGPAPTADRRPVGDPLLAQPSRQGRGRAVGSRLEADEVDPVARRPGRRLPHGPVRRHQRLVRGLHRPHGPADEHVVPGRCSTPWPPGGLPRAGVEGPAPHRGQSEPVGELAEHVARRGGDPRDATPRCSFRPWTTRPPGSSAAGPWTPGRWR